MSMLTTTEKASLSILLVDDEPKNIQLLANILKEEGYHFEFAMSGGEALEWSELRQFDTILLDIMMPGMNGMEVCQRLKANPKTQDTPVLFLTAKGELEDIVKGFQAGAADYIVKPFHRQELLARLETHLELSLDKRKLQQTSDELEHALNQMKQQHQQLKMAQTQLVHSEKMASLGVLVAGVTHEINNPNNFLHSGATNVKSRLEQLEQFIYELAGNNATSEIRQAFEERFRPIYRNLDAIESGSQRIKAIVQGLRSFSRLEEAEQKAVSLIDGLQSTLTLVQARYHPQVEFRYDFLVDPEVECAPAQLNQVFLNVALNACQAILERSTSEGLLQISTRLQDHFIGIAFQDNGVGMTEEIKAQMFQPFFTTKPVGAGVGLGLSIAFGIIENHHGHIDVDTALNRGTCITLWIPLHPPSESQS